MHQPQCQNGTNLLLQGGYPLRLWKILCGEGRASSKCVSLYLGWRWGWGSFISSTECLPLPRIEVGEGLICIVRVSPSTLGGGGGLAHLHRQSVSLYLGWRWGRGSFASFTMSLPLPGMEVGERLICNVRMSPPTLGGGGGGAHLHCQSVSLYLGWRWGRGSFASFTISLPYLHPRWRGGAHLHHQSVSLYVGWRWGWGSFTSSTEYLPLPWGRSSFASSECLLYLGGRGSFASSESLPLPWMEVGEGLVCIVRMSPDILGGGEGGAHLHHSQCHSLYLGWRWGRGSFASSECLPLPWGEGLVCIVRVSLYLGWRWGRGSFCIVRVSPST